MFAEIDLATPANDAVDWLLDNFGWLFDAIGTVATDVVGWIESALTAPPPAVMIALFALIPLLLRRWGIAVFAVLAFTLVDQMQLWTETMQSLAVVLVATAVAVAVGVPLGIWAARRRLVSVLVRPLLDLMQTTPRSST